MGSGVTGTTIDQWTTHNALLPGGRNPGDMSLTASYANTLSANYHKIYNGDWESSIAMDRMGLAYGYWGEAAMMAGVYGASAMGMLYPSGGDSGYARDYKDALTAAGNNARVNINNDVLGAPRAGSVLKLDSYHAFSDIVDNYAGFATRTSINNGTLYQVEGSLNGVTGRFEWTIDSPSGLYPGQVSHRYFVTGGTVNGVPIKP